MVAGCGMTCIKYTVFFVNFLFFCLGGVGVGLGIYALVDKSDMSALTKVDSSGRIEDFNGVGLIQSGAIVLIVAGGILLVVGFLGCCGAVKEVKCLLGLYAAFIILVLIIEVVAGALAIAFRDRIDGYLSDGLLKGLKSNYDGNRNSSNAFSRAFDFAQVEFKCCGVNNKTDFMYTPWYNRTGRSLLIDVPNTCCELTNRDGVLNDNEEPHLAKTSCPNSLDTTANFKSTPCYSAIRDWVVSHAAAVIGIAFAIVAVEIFAVIFACCLYRQIES